MKTKLLLAGVLVLGFTTPTALAHHAADESLAGVAVPTNEEADIPEEGNTYWVDDEPSVWKETNSHTGLQTEQTSYDASNDQCKEDTDTFKEGDATTDSDDICVVSPDERIL